MINGNYVGVWERLQQYPAFVNEFNKYNHKLKNALTILSEQKHDIQGREKEVKRLAQIMERPKTPVAALLGQAGVGKSALVEDFIKRIGRNEVTSVPGREYFVVSLRVGSLKAMGNDALQSALSNMLTELKALETLAKRTLNNNKIRLILFIDEFHMLVTIFGPGTKIGGDLMKDLLARPPIRVIAATTRKEFDSTIAVDEPFKERFKEIQLNELPTNVVLNICKNWWLSNTKIPIPSDDIFIKVLLANKAYRAQQAEPRKSLDILEDMVAYVMINRNRITEQVIDDIFKERFHINLNLDFDAEAIFANVKSKVKGQTLALYELHRALRAVTYKINKNPNKPIMTLLFSGPTGVGKTATVKAIEEVLYPNENVLQIFNMPDYKLPESEPVFRKNLGEKIRHQPNSIILLDEFEKASDDIKNSMLAILDEGIVNFNVVNREGLIEVQQVSLRNTIIIATTNAGHQIFKNNAEFSLITDGATLTPQAKSEYEKLKGELVDFLKVEGFKPEMLNRFNRIIPYRNLTKNVMINISEKIMQNCFDNFYKTKGIIIETPEKQLFNVDGQNIYTTDLAIYLAVIKANSENSDSGGARRLKTIFEAEIEDELIDHFAEHPQCKRFKIYVSKDSRVYDPGASYTKGGIIVDAIY